jgi:hypothetical protein
MGKWIQHGVQRWILPPKHGWFFLNGRLLGTKFPWISRVKCVWCWFSKYSVCSERAVILQKCKLFLLPDCFLQAMDGMAFLTDTNQQFKINGPPLNVPYYLVLVQLWIKNKNGRILFQCGCFYVLNTGHSLFLPDVCGLENQKQGYFVILTFTSFSTYNFDLI